MVCDPDRRIEDGVMLDGTHEQPSTTRVGVVTRPVDALDGEVVALGSAAGEDHLARASAQGSGYRLPRLLDDPAGAATGGVQRRSVADLAEELGHAVDRFGKHRRRRRMVEVAHCPTSVEVRGLVAYSATM